jgi:hypothetical protein
VIIWDVTTGQKIHTLERDASARGGVNGVAFSPDGSRLASGSLDGTAELWDVNTGQVIHSLRGYTDKVLGVAFSPDGKRLASASWDGTVKLWDVATGQEALTLTSHTDGVFSVAFSPDGKRLASASLDGTVKLWDARPWTSDEGTVEREALGLLDFLFARPLSKADIRAHLRALPTIRPEARQLALSLMERYREEDNPERYHQASWSVVRQRYLNAFQYRFALWQADTARRLTPPDRGKYATLLGAAQYRAGDYESARKTLAEADRLNQGSPADLAFLAMTQHQLGKVEEARKTLTRLREVMRNPVAATNREAADSLREAESLLAGP